MKPLDVRPPPLDESRWVAIEEGVYANLDAATPGGRRGLGRIPKAMWMAAAASMIFVAGLALGARPWSSARTTTPPAPTLVAPVPQLTLNGASVILSPGAVVAADGVSVERGTAVFDVPADASTSRTFIVTTPQARIESNGAKFRLDVDPSETRIAVNSGTAHAITRGIGSSVGLGESWKSSSVAIPPPPPAPSSTPSSHTPQLHVPMSNESSQAKFEVAESLERSDPEHAIAEYDAIVRSGGPWADIALFAEGRLQADRGKRDEARRLLRDYLERYPTGPNAKDAQALLTRLEQ